MPYRGEVRDLGSLAADCERLEVEYAVYIIIASCKALVHADPRGAIHPSRILISHSGDVTIGDIDVTAHDFGYIAPEFGDVPAPRFRFRETRVLKDNRMQIESWGRIAPEKEFEVDRPRAAVFSLGCILWELLAGRRLYVGETDYQTLQLAIAAHVPPLADVDPDLEAIVRKALAKNVGSRYQTLGQFGDALAGYLVTRSSN